VIIKGPTPLDPQGCWEGGNQIALNHRMSYKGPLRSKKNLGEWGGGAITVEGKKEGGRGRKKRNIALEKRGSLQSLRKETNLERWENFRRRKRTRGRKRGERE